MIDVVSNSIAGIALLAVLIVTAGCVGGLPGGEATGPAEPTPTPAEATETPGMATEEPEMTGDGGDKAARKIAVYPRHSSSNGSTTIVQADILFLLQLHPDKGVKTFTDTMICVYDTNGTVLHHDTTNFTTSHEKGGEWREIQFPMPNTTAYLVVNHPEFDAYHISRKYAKFRPNPNGTLKVLANPRELSWIPSENPGRCG